MISVNPQKTGQKSGGNWRALVYWRDNPSQTSMTVLSGKWKILDLACDSPLMSQLINAFLNPLKRKPSGLPVKHNTSAGFCLSFNVLLTPTGQGQGPKATEPLL